MNLRIKKIKDFKIYTKNEKGEWTNTVYIKELHTFIIPSSVNIKAIQSGIGEYNDNRYKN